MIANIHGFPILSVTAVGLFVILSIPAYVFCLLLIDGYESRRRGIGTISQWPDEYESNLKNIHRALNIQAAKGGVVLSAIVALILHAGCWN
ncbi:MAG: hypothetical protein H0U23_15780 [Blastocatellia bacterium]|nr:hypothetical protein [Blastocatellia bacterium]